jgi:hypothetical protein
VPWICTETKLKDLIGEGFEKKELDPQILKNSIRERRQIKIKFYKEVET